MKHSEIDPPKEHPFHVDLHGVVDLLSRHIYSVPQVFVRELIQNGVDAIAARQSLTETSPDKAPSTAEEPRILIHPIHEGRNELSVVDNGIGITADEAVNLLATVGRTSKRDAIGFRRDSYLGQFGIGLLSCFTVANEITVISRSLHAPYQAIRWVGCADGTFTITELEAAQSDALPFGTTVRLSPRGDDAELLSLESVEDAARTYARYLPTRIDIDTGNGHQRRITELPLFTLGAIPPDPDSHESVREHARARLGENPFDIIDIGTADGRLEGLAYVLSRPIAAHTRRRHSIYSQRMLVAHTDTDLIPSWAFFIECELSATGLTTTASREDLVRDESFHDARDHIASCIRGWLRRLSIAEPERMTQFTALHELALQQVCLTDHELASAILPHLTLQTDRGPLTVEELTLHPVIRVSSSVDEFRQLAALLSEDAPPLINGGVMHSYDIAHLISTMGTGVRVYDADIETVINAVDAPPLADTERANRLENRLSTIFANEDVRPLIRSFEPTDVPSVFVTDRVASARQELRKDSTKPGLWTSLLGAIDERRAEVNRAARGHDTTSDTPSHVLCLNWQNPLVRRLTHADDTALDRCAQVLRVQALTSSRRPLSGHDQRVLNQALTDLVDLALKFDDSMEYPQ